jgi:hypothetical protein
MWLRIAKLGDLPADITPHVLRHSFASLAADLGYNEPTIASLLGHKTHSITSRYVHSADAVLLAAADAVANATMKLMGDKPGADPASVISTDPLGLPSTIHIIRHELASAGMRAERVLAVDQAVVAGIRRTSETLAADTFNSRAVSRTPRP